MMEDLQHYQLRRTVIVHYNPMHFNFKIFYLNFFLQCILIIYFILAQLFQDPPHLSTHPHSLQKKKKKNKKINKRKKMFLIKV